MKTESEFQDKLKKHMRRARKGLMPQIIAKHMNVYPGVYFALETGMVTLSVYQLYQYMHATGKDAEYIKQLFDDNWHIPPRHTPAPEEETSEL